MTVNGIVQNGAIVLDNGATLPEGVRVEVIVKDAGEPTGGENVSLRDVLAGFAGCMEGLPPDMAAQHDHYLHGTPKR